MYVCMVVLCVCVIVISVSYSPFILFQSDKSFNMLIIRLHVAVAIGMIDYNDADGVLLPLCY